MKRAGSEKNLLFVFLVYSFVFFTNAVNAYETKDSIIVERLLKQAHAQLDISFEKALQLGKTALVLSTEYTYKRGIAKSYLQIGRVYRRQKDFTMAMDYFLKAAFIFDGLKDYVNLASLNNSIALIYFDKQDNKKGIAYELKALEQLAKEPHLNSDDSVRYINIYNQLGAAHLSLKNNSKALNNFHTALKVACLIGDSQSIAITYDNISKVYIEENRYPVALNFTLKAYHLKLKFGDIVDAANSMIDLGNIMEKMNQNKKALAYYLKANDLIDSIDLIDMKVVSLIKLSDIYQKTGDFAQSLHFLQQLMLMKDSLAQKMYDNKIIEMEAVYQNNQKQHENEFLHHENALKEEKLHREIDQKSALMTGMGVIFVFAISLFYYQRKVSIIRKQKIQIQNDGELAESRFIALQARMNPHFIFNALSSIQYFITSNDKSASLLYLSKFARLLRQVLDNSTGKKVNLDDEIGLIRSYIELESLRFENEFNFHIDIEEKVALKNVYIPSMIMQPFIENAIVHGLLHHKGEGFLQIRIRKINEKICCDIIDNGIGRKKSAEINVSKNNNHQSMGIPIAVDRLKIFQEKNDKSEPVQIVDLFEGTVAVGTHVKLILPIMK